MKLSTNIHRVSAHCWKGFQGHRSKVKIMTTLYRNCNIIIRIPTRYSRGRQQSYKKRRGDIFRLCGIEVDLNWFERKGRGEECPEMKKSKSGHAYHETFHASAWALLSLIFCSVKSALKFYLNSVINFFNQQLYSLINTDIVCKCFMSFYLILYHETNSSDAIGHFYALREGFYASNFPCVTLRRPTLRVLRGLKPLFLVNRYR